MSLYSLYSNLSLSLFLLEIDMGAIWVGSLKSPTKIWCLKWRLKWGLKMAPLKILQTSRRTKSMSREKRKISLDLINLDNGIETEAITGPVYNLLRALISSNGLLLWAKCAQSQAVTPDIVMILLGLSSWYNLEVVYYKLHQLFDIRVMF